MVGCKLIEKERNASENHREQIVEFVGNAAREMPDRLHLLCLREIVVGALQVPIEAGIVQGDRSLRSERLREPGVVRVIDPPCRVCDAERTEDAILQPEWDGEE